MDEDTDIPFPILFNPFKHHRNHILRILKGASSEVIINLLDPICNNYIDLYTGTLMPEAIGNAVISILKSNGVLPLDDFTRWVATKNGYRQIILEDQSEWIIRKSNESERYIHIHPARTGTLTIRFKGSTLKTVYLLKTGFGSSKETVSLEKVNQVRMQIGLSPIKKLERSKGILNCYEKFFDQEKANHGMRNKKLLNTPIFVFMKS
jgi:hypothetical protein